MSREEIRGVTEMQATQRAEREATAAAVAARTRRKRRRSEGIRRALEMRAEQVEAFKAEQRAAVHATIVAQREAKARRDADERADRFREEFAVGGIFLWTAQRRGERDAPDRDPLVGSGEESSIPQPREIPLRARWRWQAPSCAAEVTPCLNSSRSWEARARSKRTRPGSMVARVNIRAATCHASFVPT